MMNYIFYLTSVFIAIYAYTFARWLGNKGNRPGMFGVFFLIILNLSLSIYRIVNGS